MTPTQIPATKMATNGALATPVQDQSAGFDPTHDTGTTHAPSEEAGKRRIAFGKMLKSRRKKYSSSVSDAESAQKRPDKWSFGVLNDTETDEVPGSILMLSKVHDRNEPLGFKHPAGHNSTSSLPSPLHTNHPSSMPPQTPQLPTPSTEKKKTDSGIVLNPQPDESPNDPLNWPAWRRDVALVSLGFFCMLGGGMTPVLAAGFNEVAETYDVSVPQVALTTGLYMLGLGLGSVIMSPTAILFGKRPVYLFGSVLFVLSAVWCAASKNYPSLVVARIFMGIAVSPVECLPSATVAEIFFLHERAYRLGIYTLLLLGGKNLIPLVSAAIINSLGWRWVFWIVAVVVGFGGALLFFFVPETFWDRTPRPKKHNRSRGPSRAHSHTSLANIFRHQTPQKLSDADVHTGSEVNLGLGETPTRGAVNQRRRDRHAHFGSPDDEEMAAVEDQAPADAVGTTNVPVVSQLPIVSRLDGGNTDGISSQSTLSEKQRPETNDDGPAQRSNLGADDTTAAMNEKVGPPELKLDLEGIVGDRQSAGYFPPVAEKGAEAPVNDATHPTLPITTTSTTDPLTPSGIRYTNYYRAAPPKTYRQTLRPYAGRMSNDSWLRVAVRPFILFAYPSILWSTAVYSLSVGWLIVLSESVSTIYESRSSYNFTSLQTGLVYLSPFIGGVLGTAVAGKVSDIIVRFMARRNGGIYEPEFRLVMAIPVALCTTIGLMGYGWSAQERDKWIVPTIFFGVISFGCCVGSTTAITFAVDSYRQYAGEALVTLNFSKNVLHGFIFSLFFNRWLQSDGPKDVFIALGGIQMFFLLWSIPMYIFGKRCRMWTVRRNLMEKF